MEQFRLWLEARLEPYGTPMLVLLVLSSAVLFLTAGLPAIQALPGHALLPAVPIVVFSVAYALIGFVIRRRYAVGPMFVPGAHALHFSEFGINHTGPSGTHRWPWPALTGVEITVGYVFLLFRGLGTVPVPVDDLKAFGDTPDEGFLTALAPLIRAGQHS